MKSPSCEASKEAAFSQIQIEGLQHVSKLLHRHQRQHAACMCVKILDVLFPEQIDGWQKLSGRDWQHFIDKSLPVE